MKKLLQIQANQKHFTSSWLSSDWVPRHAETMVAHNCHGKTKNKNITAKPKTSWQKQNTSRQNQKPHGKTKYFTAKAK